MLSSTDDVWFESGILVTKQLQAAGIQVLKPVAFGPGYFKRETLSEIKRSGMRIIMLLAYGNDAAQVAGYALNDLMTSVGWGWLLLSDALRVSDMSGWIYFIPLLSEGTQAFAAEQVKDYSKSHFGISSDSVDLPSAVMLYNAVMLYAHAATAVQMEGGDLHDGQAVTAAVRNTSFIGAGGGVVALDEQGDRLGPYEIMNYLSEVKSVAVGMYIMGQYKATKTGVLWPGGTTTVPADYFSGEL